MVSKGLSAVAGVEVHRVHALFHLHRLVSYKESPRYLFGSNKRQFLKGTCELLVWSASRAMSTAILDSNPVPSVFPLKNEWE